ncbi:MAG: alpha-dextrin endo,6-alpha-glucosidase [Chitinophagaceae bacterium]|nr:alpha-dextrin endo,6-alpha-glucosidase [Chitinophagaceae bacterium]
MKKIFHSFIALACVAFAVHSQAQYSLRLIVNTVGAKKLDDVYVAGNFNNWNAGDANYKLKPFAGGRKAIVIKDIAAGSYEYKFTRGDWKKVETTAKGEAVKNRFIKIQNDTTVEIDIPGWSDDFPDKPKPNTATAQVHLMDSAFFIPQLNRYRRIWIYLPKSYSQLKNKYYPVLYMQDGQNLFNEQTAAFGEWGVDEALDSLQQQTGKECIVIGIDNGGAKRLNEYSPYDFSLPNSATPVKGEGKQYMAFLVSTLKPYVDAHYRTKKDEQNTFIAGSSMGGLISAYAIIAYPHVFGAAGIFSPSFWASPKLYEDAALYNWPKSLHRFYFYAGRKEGEGVEQDLNRMADIIEKKTNIEVIRLVYPLGQHNEATWRKEFPEFYKWLIK